jgi:hypothetical protein
MFFIVSTSQQEINVCSTAFRYQLSSLASAISPASLGVEQQESKMELETKLLGTISFINTLGEAREELKIVWAELSILS